MVKQVKVSFNTQSIRRLCDEKVPFAIFQIIFEVDKSMGRQCGVQWR